MEMRVCYGGLLEVYRKECFWGVFVAFKLTIRCVLGDQGCDSTTFWTKLGSQALMHVLHCIVIHSLHVMHVM